MKHLPHLFVWLGLVSASGAFAQAIVSAGTIPDPLNITGVDSGVMAAQTEVAQFHDGGSMWLSGRAQIGGDLLSGGIVSGFGVDGGIGAFQSLASQSYDGGSMLLTGRAQVGGDILGGGLVSAFGVDGGIGTFTTEVAQFHDGGSMWLSGDEQVGGTVMSATEASLLCAYINTTTATNGTYAGGATPPHKIQFTRVIGETVGTVSSGASSSTTFQTTDGTNTCTFAFTCQGGSAQSDTSTNGGKMVAGVNGSGTGCVMAASTSFDFKTTSQCGTQQPTWKNFCLLYKTIP